MAELDGAGIPLSYCLLTTASAVEAGKRTNALEAWAIKLRVRWSINPKFVLLDKDMAEIAMSRRVWPQAKVQLCFWHLKDAVTKRIEQKKLSTTPYKPKLAHNIFPFIDLAFKPTGRSDPKEYEGGRNPDLEADAPVPERPWALKLHLPFPAIKQVQMNQEQDIVSDDSGDDSSTEDKHHEFCPSNVRQQVLEMVGRHYHAHPFIPGYAHGSAQAIHEWATREMYRFSAENDLPELWAYLWGNWYRPGRWELWARSACEDTISILKTTMIMESQ
jgi:hypothetical protein